MKTPVINHSSPWVTFLCLLLGIQLRAAQFVELTAEIETVDWHSEAVSRQPPWTVRCVVGTNAWRIDGRFVRQGNSTWSFTGTNVVERTVYSDASGTQRSQTFESVDGNPGRPARTQDLMLLPTAKIAWLALCSGPCLKAEGRRLFPPSDLWKELVDAPSGFSDKTVVFGDALGLPESVNLYLTNQMPIPQYRVLSSTNVSGWQFPLEFYLAQSRPAMVPDSHKFGTNGWELQLTARGKVTAIGVGTKSLMETELQRPAEK